jgi:hypothetical protein
MLVGVRDSLKKAIWGKVTVRLEGVVDLESNPDVFLRKFEDLFRICNDNRQKRHGKDNREVVIDLSEVEKIFPSTLIFLLGLKESLQNDFSLDFAVKERSQLHEYLSTCGFAKFFDMPIVPEDSFVHLTEKSDVIPLDIGDQILDLEASARRFIDLVDHKNRMDTFFRNRSEESVYEVLKNIKDHSDFTQFYMIGQTYQKTKQVRFVFYDNGKGIKSHMTHVKYKKKHQVFKKYVSEADFRKMLKDPATYAIETASIYGVSATKYQHNSGAGLNFLISDFSKPLNGTISILSEDGYVSWTDGEIGTRIALPINVRGTMVSITAKGLTE